MSQLISHYFVTDFATWKTAFDADDESRRNAGLTVLQIWKDADSTEHAFVLCEVNDRTRAEDWTKRTDALSVDDGGTVTRASHFFIDTA